MGPAARRRKPSYADAATRHKKSGAGTMLPLLSESLPELHGPIDHPVDLRPPRPGPDAQYRKPSEPRASGQARRHGDWRRPWRRERVDAPSGCTTHRFGTYSPARREREIGPAGTHSPSSKTSRGAYARRGSHGREAVIHGAGRDR